MTFCFHHVKSASVSHAGLVTGKDSKRFVFGCNIEFWQVCEVDLPAEDIFSITRTV